MSRSDNGGRSRPVMRIAYEVQGIENHVDLRGLNVNNERLVYTFIDDCHEIGGRSRPVMREIEVADGFIRDTKTKEIVPSHEICREYNRMLNIVQQVAVLGCAERDVVEQAQLLLRDGPGAVNSKRTTASGGAVDGE